MKKRAVRSALWLIASTVSLSSVLCTAAHAEPATFSLTNNTDVVITRLDAETIAGDDWGTLEEGRLHPGETVQITIDDRRTDCSYHFRVYYEDDGTKFRDYYHVNVCDNPAWSVP